MTRTYYVYIGYRPLAQALSKQHIPQDEDAGKHGPGELPWESTGTGTIQGLLEKLVYVGLWIQELWFMIPYDSDDYSMFIGFVHQLKMTGPTQVGSVRWREYIVRWGFKHNQTVGSHPRSLREKWVWPTRQWHGKALGTIGEIPLRTLETQPVWGVNESQMGWSASSKHNRTLTKTYDFAHNLIGVSTSAGNFPLLCWYQIPVKFGSPLIVTRRLRYSCWVPWRVLFF